MRFAEMGKEELQSLYDSLMTEYEAYKQQGLHLNMSRGKPAPEQLDLCAEVNSCPADFICEDGTDVRNYGALDGIPEAKRLFGEIFGMPASNVIVGGSSSLNMMYDTISRAYLHGVLPGSKPWSEQGQVKFLCPTPGYDRHFLVTQRFGIEMIPVPMTEDGPDMDIVEHLVAIDEKIKGIWCVPMYSNPDGITYSDETVRRFAALKTAAADFRIFWDNAYCVHHLDLNDRDHLINLYEECCKNGTEDKFYTFASTSKITMAGSGICAMAMSSANYEWTLKQLTIQTICHDNVNQLRHSRYLPNLAAVEQLMAKHAHFIKPKFAIVLNALEEKIKPYGIAHWHNPKGGYFISFFAMEGCAKRIVDLCKEAGVELTAAGATYPYGHDPQDSNIRIAPTSPSQEELQKTMDIFCVAVKIASLEKLLHQ